MARAPITTQNDRPGSRRVSALSALWPFIRPYRGMALAAIGALILTAGISLILPLAVRRVVDGFDVGSILLDEYFEAALAIVAALAVGTGLRYYLVTRLGERVVADIRKAVFDRVIGRSPAFFEQVMTGEIVSRITTDTTVILSVIGSSVSVALRNMLLMVGGLVMLFLTSAKLTGLVLLLVPVILIPIIGLGRRLRVLARENQDWIAASSGMAAEALQSADGDTIAYCAQFLNSVGEMLEDRDLALAARAARSSIPAAQHLAALLDSRLGAVPNSLTGVA